MKNKLYINGIASISAQAGNAVFSGSIAEYHQNIIPAITPDYKEFIPASALRRMSGAIKMGLTATKIALKDAEISMPGAIITGTGKGCQQDTEKFLETLLEQHEEFLSPTAFIQSTHNTVGGQIALNLKCKAYNVTYTQNSGSLESAFMDAQLQFLEQPELDTVLVGGVDEVSKKITPFLYLDGQLKQDETRNLDLFKTESPGTITSEGAHFFSISSTKTLGTYAELLDVLVFNSHTSEDVSERIHSFLKENSLTEEAIELVIFGNNGDSGYDHFYADLQAGIFRNKTQLGYKHLVGDYNTVSGYAVWLACNILKNGVIPGILKLNSVPVKTPKNILIYNQYLGENHSIILLSSR